MTPQVETIPPLHKLEADLHQTLVEIYQQIAETTTFNEAMQLSDLLGPVASGLCSLQSLARTRAASFIGRDPFGDQR